MGVRVEIEGMDELRKALRDLPAELRADGMAIVRATTEGAAHEIASQYRQKTGNLRRGVKVSFPSSTVLVGLVASTSPHSHLYEDGTAQRHNRKGANRGRMPSHRITAHVAPKWRARMFAQLKSMLQAKGLIVSEG
jgi:hypothetical protein